MNWAVKHRPKTFEDVVGQPEKAHLRILMQDRENFPPVLILRGPSGTGKTTIARIVAMALNCTSLGPKGDPCGTCDSCAAILTNSFVGVYEHNAAIENGADAMRSLQEKTFLYPQGTHNVFILDEVQSLSGQAWKVLLKTFEEPVPGSVFVLVTSEANKIPRTIQTRALTYDFGRVDAASVRSFVEKVCEQEGATVEGLDLIIDLAEGSVRDAVKMAEQCYRAGKSAHELYAGRDSSLAIWEGVASNDHAAALAGLDEMWRSSGDAQYIIEKLGASLQRVMYQYYGIPQTCTPETIARLNKVSNQLKEFGVSRAMEVLADWFPRTRALPHLMFLLSDLMRVLHVAPDKAAPVTKSLGGMVKTENGNKPLSAEQVNEQLEKFNFL